MNAHLKDQFLNKDLYTRRPLKVKVKEIAFFSSFQILKYMKASLFLWCDDHFSLFLTAKSWSSHVNNHTTHMENLYMVFTLYWLSHMDFPLYSSSPICESKCAISEHVEMYICKFFMWSHINHIITCERHVITWNVCDFSVRVTY